MIRKHAEYTGSDRAWKVLALWEAMVPKFVKVYPNDYRRVLETQKRFKASGPVGRGGDHGGVRGERARSGAGGGEVMKHACCHDASAGSRSQVLAERDTRRATGRIAIPETDGSTQSWTIVQGHPQSTMLGPCDDAGLSPATATADGQLLRRPGQRHLLADRRSHWTGASWPTGSTSERGDCWTVRCDVLRVVARAVAHCSCWSSSRTMATRRIATARLGQQVLDLRARHSRLRSTESTTSIRGRSNCTHLVDGRYVQLPSDGKRAYRDCRLGVELGIWRGTIGDQNALAATVGSVPATVPRADAERKAECRAALRAELRGEAIDVWTSLRASRRDPDESRRTIVASSCIEVDHGQANRISWNIPRELPLARPPAERVRDWDEFHDHADEAHAAQAGRPLHGLRRAVLPHRHAARRHGRRAARSTTSSPSGTTWSIAACGSEALDRLHKTNNFPEFTGRVCPAPCEGSCVLGINEPPVTIKTIECAIIDKGFEEGWVVPEPPADAHRQEGRRRRLRSRRAGRRRPAQQGRPLGHRLRARRPHRRPAHVRHPQHEARQAHVVAAPRRPDGGRGRHVRHQLRGRQGLPGRASCCNEFDAVVLCGGATKPRDLPVEGRNLKGIHFAMEFLHANTKSLLDTQPRATATTSPPRTRT